MAGSFGFESGHYDVSMAIGERNLLPAIRGAERNTLLVADGFSCRTQIEHGTGRRALHLAEVIRDGLRRAGQGGEELMADRALALTARRPLVAAGAAVLVGAAVGYLLGKGGES
jgi:hypothetical protein